MSNDRTPDSTKRTRAMLRFQMALEQVFDGKKELSGPDRLTLLDKIHKAESVLVDLISELSNVGSYIDAAERNEREQVPEETGTGDNGPK